MATSGSTNFTINASEIIKEALELIGAIPIGTTVPGHLYASCLRTLNLMCKSWMSEYPPIYLWTITEKKNIVLSNVDSFTLGPSGTGSSITMEKPMRILHARLRHNTNETDFPLTQILRPQYMQGVLSKTATSAPGFPTMFYYDSQRETGRIHLNAVPNTDTINNYTLRFDYPRRIEDFDDPSDDPDFLQEYLETLTTNLAERVHTKFPAVDVQKISGVLARAQYLYQVMKTNAGPPEEELFFEPERVDDMNSVVDQW